MSLEMGQDKRNIKSVNFKIYGAIFRHACIYHLDSPAICLMSSIIDYYAPRKMYNNLYEMVFETINGGNLNKL